MVRSEKRGVVWEEMLTLQTGGLGSRVRVSEQRDKFVLNPQHPAATGLTFRPEANGFVRADRGSLLFRNAAASLRSAVPTQLRLRAMKSAKGLEFRWTTLENADLRRLFQVIRAHAGLP